MQIANQIQWRGNGCFAFDTTPSIVINPWRVVRASTPTDILLVTHADFHACSPADIAKLSSPQTRVFGTLAAARDLETCEVLRTFQAVTIGRVSIKAVPAAAADRIGYLISIQHHDILYLPDTTLPTGAARFRPDVLILPLDGDGSADPEEAARTTAQIRPRCVLPFHWNLAGSSRVDYARFAQELNIQTGAAHIQIVQPQLV